jgi:hypothetical protein
MVARRLCVWQHSLCHTQREYALLYPSGWTRTCSGLAGCLAGLRIDVEAHQGEDPPFSVPSAPRETHIGWWWWWWWVVEMTGKR